MCLYVSYQTPSGRLLVSEMSGVDGEIRIVCLSHGGSAITQCVQSTAGMVRARTKSLDDSVRVHDTDNMWISGNSKTDLHIGFNVEKKIRSRGLF